MPAFHLEKPHFLDGIWYPAGAVVDWAGEKSEHMVPIDEFNAKRHERAKRGGAPLNRGRVISNPNANPPVITGNTMPAKVGMGGPEAPSVPVPGPKDEQDPDFVPPTGSKPLYPGADEAASAPTMPADTTADKPKPKGT